jgi:hypothetical protein
MTDTELLNEFVNRFLIQKLRPVLYEVVNECLSSQKRDEIPIQASDDSLWSAVQVMAYFSCAKTTVYKWRKQGLIKAHKLGSKTFYKKKDVLKALKQKTL